jgi:hypothetical protein
MTCLPRRRRRPERSQGGGAQPTDCADGGCQGFRYRLFNRSPGESKQTAVQIAEYVLRVKLSETLLLRADQADLAEIRGVGEVAGAPPLPAVIGGPREGP